MEIEVIPCDMGIEITPIYFPNLGVVEIRLPEEIVSNLWKLIEESEEQPEDMRDELAGNISSSLRLDKDSPLLEDFNQKVVPALVNEYIQEFGSVLRHFNKSLHSSLNLESLWVNFQNKHEFNPPHDHSGVYSFVIWMQIPTSFKEQSKLPIAGMGDFISDIGEPQSNQSVSNFAFTYTNILGKTEQYMYNMEKEMEACMVLFPSNLTHQVFPFYESDDVRISISGNLDLET